MSQTTEAQTTPPTSEEVIGKVNESIAALQEAQKTVVEGAQLLAAHVNDPTAHGAAIPEVVEQQLPTPVMEGTSLKWEKKDGTIVAGPVDLKGAPGQDGADGDTGPRPEHRWEGTKLLVQNSDGSWPAEGVDLKGDKGDTGQVEGLSDAVDSNSSTTPASSKAVKTAYDKAVTAQNAANTADSKAQAAQSAADTAQAAAEAADAKAQTAQSTADAAQAAAEAADAKAQAAQSAADAAQSAADAAQAGVDGIPLASASVAGLVKIGTNLSVSDGTVSVPSATPSKRGVVFSSTTAAANAVPQAGEDGTLDESWLQPAIQKIEDSAPGIASKNALGLIKVGTGLAIRIDGTLDAVSNAVELTFTESNAEWAAPETAIYTVTCVGGGGRGGSGGAGNDTENYQGRRCGGGGGGGSAGDLKTAVFALEKGTTVSIIVGGPGGASSFGSYITASGGSSGGTGGTAGSSNGTGGTSSYSGGAGGGGSLDKGGSGGRGAPGYGTGINAGNGNNGGAGHNTGYTSGAGGAGGSGYGAGGGGGGGGGWGGYGGGSGGVGAPGIVLIRYTSLEEQQ